MEVQLANGEWKQEKPLVKGEDKYHAITEAVDKMQRKYGDDYFDVRVYGCYER